MKTARFVFSYAICAALDAGATWFVYSVAGLSPFSARAVGAIAGLLSFCLLQKFVFQSRAVSLTLTVIIGVISTAVSFGLFTLLLERNPLIQWYAAFVAATVAALLLCGFGYRRAYTISAGGH